MPSAELVLRRRRVFSDGAIMEMVIWRVPAPVPPSDHGFKYRLYYGRDGRRLIGYDNERGKGDRRHVLGQEEPYTWAGASHLLRDFLAEVKAMRGGQW